MSKAQQCITRSIYLKFVDNSWSSNCNISIPFPVKQIKIKQLVYQDDTTFPNYWTGIYSGLLLSSDLVNYNTLGIVSICTYNSQNTSHFATLANGIRYEFLNPRRIDGSYNFVLKGLNNKDVFSGINNLGTNNYELLVMIEFSGVMDF